MKTFTLVTLLFFSNLNFAQNAIPAPQRSDFRSRVQFGAGLGLSIGSGYTNVSLSPSAIYNFNNYFAAGAGLQASYALSENYFESIIYGGSLIGIFNPIQKIQLSAELEQLRVNTTFKTMGHDSYKENAWNTGLFLGAGYRMKNVTIGGRYNVLYKDTDYAYTTAFMPYVRVFL